jgi:hypothetical protein
MQPSDFSTEEYECLGALLSQYYAWTGTLSELSQTWLYGRLEHPVITPGVQEFMALPLDQVPLYVSEDSRMLRVLAIWRLKIAR